MARILKLIKNEDQGKKEGKRKASKKESELLGLIDNFYKEYQSLYALYDHLIGESAKIVFGRKGKETTSSMSSSGSDSEYFSSEEVDTNHTKFENKTANVVNQELEIAYLEVSELKRKLAYTNKEKEALTAEHNALSSKMQQAEIINKDLRIEIDRKEREILGLNQAHEAKGKQSVARIKELESQLSGLKIEMDSLRSKKRESRANKTKQKVDKNAEIQTRVLELESILRDKEDEKSALLEELIANESNSKSKIAELMAQVSNLKLEVDSLHAQRSELEEKISCKRNDASSQIKFMQKEYESLKLQRDDLEMEVERKSIEISKNLIQIESLKEELAKKSNVEKKSAQVKELEQQIDNLRNQKDDLEKMKVTKFHENNQLKLDKKELNARIFELEGSLSEREEASIQIMAMTAQNSSLKQELDSLNSQKSQLELQIERDKQANSKVTQMENPKTKLTTTGKIEDQQRINTKEEKDTTSTSRKSNKDHKQSKGKVQQTRPNQQIVERKIEDLAEKFRIGFENNIRLLYQRILVAEQLHTENKENYRKTKGKYEKQNKELEETIGTYADELKKMKDISEAAGDALDGLGLVICNFEEENGNFLNHISTLSKELQIARNWVRGATSEIKRLKHNVDVLVAQLEDKEEQEFLLREKVWKLEAKVSKEGGEKLNLMKSMTQLEKKLGKYESLMKEKDERLLSLGDEKREAIKQLCILIDYQRDRYDHLKGVFLQAQLSLRRNSRINT